MLHIAHVIYVRIICMMCVGMPAVFDANGEEKKKERNRGKRF